MIASASTVISEVIYGCIGIVFSIMKVLIPLMIVIEILRVYNAMEKLAGKLAGFTKALGMTQSAILPLIVATFMGVTYGAGTLIEMNRVNPIPKKDLILIASSFFVCHAIIETTVIWGAAGANIFIISVVRLAVALTITAIIARLPLFKGKEYGNGSDIKE